MTLTLSVDAKSDPLASSDALPMVRVAVASRELPLPAAHIVHPPILDLKLERKVLRTPTPVYVALTRASRVVLVGSQLVASHA